MAHLIIRKSSALWPNRFPRACFVVVRFCTCGEVRETLHSLGSRSPLPVTGSLLLSPHSTLSLTLTTLSHQSPPLASSPPSAPTPMDPAVRPTVMRSNEALLRIFREYEADRRDSAAQIDVGHVPVLNRPSPVATRLAGMATRSAAVAALQAAGIPSADPSTPGVFHPIP
jgi:hypothetical protein